MGNINLLGPSNPGIADKVDAQRSVNWYPVLQEAPGEQSRMHLRGRPGLVELVELPETPIRGELELDGRAFVVAGSGIYEVYADGTYKKWGAVPSTFDPVSMASLRNVIVIGDGSGFYALDLDARTVARITDAPRGRYCIYYNLRILYQGEDGQIWYSELEDPTNIPGLNFFTAEALYDDVFAIVSTESRIFLFGSDSLETWYNSGDQDNPFERIPSGVNFSGVLFPDTALRLDNTVFYIEKDEHGSGIVRRMQGSTPTRISTSAVERFIGQATTMNAYSYQEEGHTFYILNSENGTFAYDLKTGLWHERAWQNRNTGVAERHRVQHHANALGGHVVTDYESGKVYLQSLAYYDDAGQEIVKERVSPHVTADGRQIRVDELFLHFATGVGLTSGQGSDPEAMLSVSRNGAGYGEERTVKLGKKGDYNRRARFHRLGTGHDFLFKISVSDPVLTVLMGADARYAAGRR